MTKKLFNVRLKGKKKKEHIHQIYATDKMEAFEWGEHEIVEVLGEVQ